MRISDWSSDVCSSDLSRHTKAVVPGLVPGTQCPSRLKVQPLKGGAFAAGADAIAARHRHTLMPLGPGDKRRDDSCAYGAVETPPPTMWDNRRASPKDAGGLAQASGAMCSATSAAARMSILGLGGTRSVKKIGRATCRERVCQDV